MRYGLLVVLLLAYFPAQAAAQGKKKTEATFPPLLAEGKTVAVDRAADFLKKPEGITLAEGVTIAKTPPTIDFLYFPGQTYPGKPWSAWGDSLAVNGKYYAAIGDHLAPTGNAFVYEYDPQTRKFRQLVDLRQLLRLPEGHYSPGKIHSRLDLGSDGWLYFSTHRGSTTVTTERYHYQGDWILRCHPATGKTEILAHGPVPRHCLPTGQLDPRRLIFYAGTTPGVGKEDEGHFLAFDVKAKKVLCDVPQGPARALILSSSTGRVYYLQGKSNTLMRYDPARGGQPTKIDGTLGLRAASAESPQGIVYTVSQGGKDAGATLYSFAVKTEKIAKLGPAEVATQTYITSLDLDPTGRYLYYVPGAHGGSASDGSPVVQYDTQTHTRKILAFLHPYYKTKYGCALAGTYSVALDPRGETLYITWNANRTGGRVWDCCALTVLHLPASER